MKINKFMTGAMALALSVGTAVPALAAESEEATETDKEVIEVAEPEEDTELEDDVDSEEIVTTLDVEGLKSAISAADEKITDKKEYTEESIELLNSKLVVAQETLDKVVNEEEVTQEEVDQAASELQDATNELVEVEKEEVVTTETEKKEDTAPAENAKTGIAGIATVGGVLAAAGIAYVANKKA